MEDYTPQYRDPLLLQDFKRAHGFLLQFAELFTASYAESGISPRSKALKRLCISQLTETRHTLANLLDAQ